MLALAYNSFNLIFEPHFDQSISFVKYQNFDIIKAETFSIVYMVKETTSCSDNEIGNALKITFLLADAGTSVDCCAREIVQVLREALKHGIALGSELTGRLQY